MKWNVVVFAVIYRQQTTNGLSWAEQNPEKSLILSTSNDTSREFSSQMDNQHEYETSVVSSLFLICRLVMFVTAFHLLAIVLFGQLQFLAICPNVAWVSFIMNNVFDLIFARQIATILIISHHSDTLTAIISILSNLCRQREENWKTTTCTLYIQQCHLG